MATLWFCLVAFMLAMYVVLDGFDIGVGAIAPLVAKSEEERELLVRSIGPVWDGNEVWLLAAGGTLYFAFPALYAASFSGFYLPLMMVLWMLIGRGTSIELRHHVDHGVWRRFWDGIFFVASLLLAVFYGAALGNVVRGVPLDANGRFFLPMWNDMTLGPPSGVLDWYTVVVGVAALAALALHGTLWLVLKLEGPVEERARKLAGRLFWAVVATTALVTVASFSVQAQILRNLEAWPLGYFFPLLAILGLVGILLGLRQRKALGAFLASCLYLGGMLTSVAFGVFPYVLPARPDAQLGLTAPGVAAPERGLWIGLAWWIPGMLLAAGYFVYAYRNFAGKVRAEGYEG
ncbi:MAG: cytochrome d ubiquinol oxidase subunit II [Acidobacteriota bacterium]